MLHFLFGEFLEPAEHARAIHSIYEQNLAILILQIWHEHLSINIAFSQYAQRELHWVDNRISCKPDIFTSSNFILQMQQPINATAKFVNSN